MWLFDCHVLYRPSVSAQYQQSTAIVAATAAAPSTLALSASATAVQTALALRNKPFVSVRPEWHAPWTISKVWVLSAFHLHRVAV